jgi:hypothetical protein
MKSNSGNNKDGYGIYGSVSQSDIEIGKAIGQKALDVGKEKYNEMKKYAEEGKYSWRVAGFTSGILMMFISFFGFFSNLVSLSPFNAILDLYIFCFGLISAALEYKERFFTQSYIDIIKREALFLYKPYGRAAFYFFLGILLIGKGGLFSIIVGIYTAFVGFVVYQGSIAANLALAELKGNQYSLSDIEGNFEKFDFNKDGSLDTTELSSLCQSMGSTLSRLELESAVFILDKDGDGKIQKQEFIDWWTSV